ncbi:THAP domain-containing protein 5-like [Heptranchias perlo]|uniref:THAP domain-containing protein 5-like n=1 Tax=Heptranchias perlo TaxID=212740 RepID=UPI00355A78B6
MPMLLTPNAQVSTAGGNLKKRKALARSNGNKRQKKGLEAQSSEEDTVLKMETVPVLSPALNEPNALAVLAMATEPTLSTETTISASVTELDKIAMSAVSDCVESLSEAIIPTSEPLPNVAMDSFESLEIDKGGSFQYALTESSALPFENVAAVETVQLTQTLASVETVGATAMSPSVETLQLVPTQTREESEPTLTSIEIVPPAAQDIETLSSFQPEPPTPVPSTLAMSIFEDLPALAVVPTYQTLSPTNMSSQTSNVLLTAATGSLKTVSGFETVLTLPSALIVPIMSTLPIVQNHAVLPPEPVIAAVETVMSTLPDTPEVQGEHSYYKNDLTIEQLEEIITNLQKKVKVIQQRERRNSARLRVMENLVRQLKRENVILEEKLKIMEMVRSVEAIMTANTCCHPLGTQLWVPDYWQHFSVEGAGMSARMCSTLGSIFALGYLRVSSGRAAKIPMSGHVTGSRRNRGYFRVPR